MKLSGLNKRQEFHRNFKQKEQMKTIVSIKIGVAFISDVGIQSF